MAIERGRVAVSEEIGAALRASLAVMTYSTVTLLARLRGWSTSHPRRTAM
jgi:hypothetical protein